MAIQIVRYDHGEGPVWGLHADGKITPLQSKYATTGAFLTEGGTEEAYAAAGTTDTIDIADVQLLSPVTRDGDYICQGMNYADHLREIGRDPADAVHNVIFTKASSCICGANDDIIRPAHVKALDYEAELALIISRPVTGPVEITEDNLHNYVGALVITNDVSARDVQVACEQFCKGKSYRTFGPTGPFLVLVSAEELRRWGELELNLAVNGTTRQSAPASEMIHKPVETLRELSEVRDLKPGDMIATGTPAGVAVKVPGKLIATVAKFMSPAKRSELLAKRAADDPAYLKPGDIMTCSIKTPDGAIDLGVQTNRIVQG